MAVVRRGRAHALVAVCTVTVVVSVLVSAGALSWPSWAAAAGLRSAAASPAPAAVPAPLQPTEALRPVGSDAPMPTAEQVTATVAPLLADPGLASVTGTVLDAATGTVLTDRAAAQPQPPGSTAKVLTTAAALLTLDPTATIPTTVVAGPDPDTVVLVGGGDPTLSALPRGRESVYPGAAKLDDLVAQVKAASTVPVRRVLVDTGLYTGDAMAPGWMAADIRGGFIAPMAPVMLDGGRLDPTAVDTPRTGTPAMNAAAAFATRIGAAAPQPGTAAPGASVLGRVQSLPIVDLVADTLQISDNVLAEALARQVAIARGKPATFAGATEAVAAALTEAGLDVTGLQMSDGSGLSTLDVAPAALLAAVLRLVSDPAATDPRTARLRPLLYGLPVAGGTGTLADRYGDAGSSAGRGWVRAKTGTLSEVNSLAGTVLDQDGRVLVFAFLSNGTPSAAARPALDAVAAGLRRCGCH